MKNYSIIILILFFFCSLLKAQVIAEGDTILCQGQEGEVAVTLTARSENIDLIDSNIYTDDIFGGVINMGFDFEFYGNTYSQVVLASNNYLSFNTANAGAYCDWTIGAAIPTGTEPATQNGILCPWQDIYPGVNGNGIIAYATTGEAPNRVFIASFCGIPMFSCTDICYSSQIKLFETTNIIETHIAEKVLCTTWNGGAAIHGLHNEDGTIAHVVTGLDGIVRNYPNAWTCEDDAWQFIPNGDDDYVIESIEFAPAVAGTDITWQDQFGNIIGTGPEIEVFPGGDVIYTAGASMCGEAGDWCGFEGGIEGTDVFITFEELSISGNESNITCYESNNGTIEVFAPDNDTWTYNLYEGVPGANENNLIDSQTLNSDSYMFENLSPGLYYATISTDECVSIEWETELIQPTEIEESTTINNTLCNDGDDGSIEIEISGGTPPYETFIGNTSTPIIDNQTGATIVFNNLVAGDYYFTTIDANGCLIPGDEVFFTINQPTAITVSSEINTEICEAQDGSIDITVSGGTPGYEYNWYDENGLISNEEDISELSGGIYELALSDINGCLVSALFFEIETELQEVEILDVQIGPATCEDAENGFIEITVSETTTGHEYNWYNENGFSSNQQDINNLSGGNYNLELSDINGCISYFSFDVSEAEGMNSDIIVSECVNNNNGEIIINTIGGTPPYSYTILNTTNNNISTNNTGAFSDLIPGDYLIETSDSFGCLNDVLVNLNETPIADFSVNAYEFDLSNTPTEFTDLSYDTNIISWIWDFGDGNTSNLQNPTNLYTAPGVYYVELEIFDTRDCQSTITKKITVLQDYYSYTPDVFTPNNDGINDTFSPSLLNIDLSSYSLMIFDRWGKMIFETTDYNQGWDGKLKDGSISPDTYSYKITYNTNLGVKKEEKGRLVMAK